MNLTDEENFYNLIRGFYVYDEYYLPSKKRLRNAEIIQVPSEIARANYSYSAAFEFLIDFWIESKDFSTLLKLRKANQWYNNYIGAIIIDFINKQYNSLKFSSYCFEILKKIPLNLQQALTFYFYSERSLTWNASDLACSTYVHLFSQLIKKTVPLIFHSKLKVRDYAFNLLERLTEKNLIDLDELQLVPQTASLLDHAELDVQCAAFSLLIKFAEMELIDAGLITELQLRAISLLNNSVLEVQCAGFSLLIQFAKKGLISTKIIFMYDFFPKIFPFLADSNDRLQSQAFSLLMAFIEKVVPALVASEFEFVEQIVLLLEQLLAKPSKGVIWLLRLLERLTKKYIITRHCASEFNLQQKIVLCILEPLPEVQIHALFLLNRFLKRRLIDDINFNNVSKLTEQIISILMQSKSFLHKEMAKNYPFHVIKKLIEEKLINEELITELELIEHVIFFLQYPGKKIQLEASCLLRLIINKNLINADLASELQLEEKIASIQNP